MRPRTKSGKSGFRTPRRVFCSIGGPRAHAAGCIYEDSPHLDGKRFSPSRESAESAQPCSDTMDIERFFQHWNLTENPFQAEEARNDALYRRVIEAAVAHPDFAKIYGNPENPATTIVFGEKGSGKTAMRLMIERRLEAYNGARSENRVWTVSYDELNPVLDRISGKLGEQDPDRVLESLRLADHQDAILSRAVTELLDQVQDRERAGNGKVLRAKLRKMSRQKRIDLAVLALLYDQPSHGQTSERWRKLKSVLRIRRWWNRSTHGLATLLFGVLGLVGVIGWQLLNYETWEWVSAAVVGGAGFGGLGIWWLVRSARNALLGRRIDREIRVVTRVRGEASRHLWDLKDERVQAQPIPSKDDQDNRYDLTSRFLRILSEIGYTGLVVLLDRVDEPVLINGESRRMKQLVWPMLNNKFLQQDRIGIKMLLPVELGHLLNGEGAEFKRSARLDKQNVVNPLKWTGATLYDLCNWRFRNCQGEPDEAAADLRSIFDEAVTSAHLIDALDQMHQPRDAFKFLYAVMLEHCRNTPGDSGEFRISRATLDQVRRTQSQRVVDLYRGVASS